MKLEQKNIEDILALTPMQEGMLFHYLKAPRGDYYFEQLSLEISGEIDKEIFEKAWNFVIETNEMLRVVFRWEKVEQPVQIILKEHKIEPGYYDFSGRGNSEKKKRLEEIKDKDRKSKFNLQEVPFRVILCKMGEAKYDMIISNHHILYDGWSNGIILKELFNTYNVLANGKKLVKSAKTKFKEFVKWHQNQDTDEQEKYWRNYLKGFDTQGELSVKRRKGKKTSNAENFRISFIKYIKDRMEDFVRKHKITMASLMYSAWGLLLQRYNNDNDVIFGTVVSGRSVKIPGIEEIGGLFINTLPLRVQTNANEKIGDLLYRIDRVLQMREKYEATSLVNIKKYSEIDDKEELFDTIVIIENYPMDSRLMLENSKLSVDSYSMIEMNHYDLTVEITIFDDIELNFTFNKEVFDETTVVRLSNHFRCSLEEMVKYPGKEAWCLEIIPDQERKQLLYEFNTTEVDYPKDKTLHQLFEEQSERTPGKVALAYKEKQLTYKELNKKSNQLARLLRLNGTRANPIVGLMPERSIEMIIGIFAILKAGGAYIPIGPQSPEERIKYMLTECRVEILLTNRNKKIFGDPSLFINLDSIENHKEDTSNLSSLSAPTDLAYVIYTSGTTGRPKGVMIEHKSVINFIKGITDVIPFTGNDRILSLTTISFDIFGLETILTLTQGAMVVVGASEEQLDVSAIGMLIKRENITIFQVTPSRLKLIISEREPSKSLMLLKYLLVGGEVLPEKLLEKTTEVVRGKIFNVYGPTETTIWSTVKDVNGAKSLNIGRPIANTRVYILSKTGLVQPLGVPGELCIAGAGLARGYLNRPELTARKFQMPNKAGYYRSYRSYKSYILYRTGDLAKWLPDGDIEFLTRLDHQVKIRGFRIELGEIEGQLLKHAKIKGTVVIPGVDKSGNEYLCAYVTGTDAAVADKKFNTSELRAYLSRALPDYMIPSHFVQLEEIPLTPSGKLDRKALPALGKALSTGSKYIPPGNHIEKTIADIWKQLLSLDKVGIHDHFFDIGGNSLLMIRLSSRLQEVFKRDLPVVTLFDYPTIDSLAGLLIRDKTGEPSINIDTGTRRADTAREKGKSRTDEIDKTNNRVRLDIAVIGMSGRFPGAKNCDEFWENLKNGVEAVTFLKEPGLRDAGVNPDMIKDPYYVPAKGILQDMEYFDASFFGYMPTEAELMDPQIRIFHECVWGALEDAGYNQGGDNGIIGLYAGATLNPFWVVQPLLSKGDSFSQQWESQQFVDKDFLCARISYKLNLRGPVVSIQTACSTSLVALDMACQGLSSGRCDMALAGGVSITLQDQMGYIYQEGMIMSPDGHCRAFDGSTGGTVGGNGVGVVVLKPLRDAIMGGDHIYALVKGSAVNNDGTNRIGFTAPSVRGQANVIEKAFYGAGVAPESIGYIETHGTGTRLGDTIELEALNQAFDTDRKAFCAIGSVKTNIGHLDAAAGIAGFIKTVLALEHKLIPPSLNFEVPNPAIDFIGSPFYVNTRLREWKCNGYPLRAGVSSFGIGGTNVHVILEEAREMSETTPPLRKHQLILLSARTPTALEKAGKNLEEYFRKNPAVDFADAAYTLQVGRKVFKHRRMLVCSEINEAAAALSNPGSGKIRIFCGKEDNRPVVFMFSGQGSQYINMGLDIYKKESVFRQEMDRCFDILRSGLGYDIKEILYPGNWVSEESPGMSYTSHRSNINQTEVAQPLIFIFEYALAKLLMKWGIKPDAMIGHSIGEYVAACLAGVFSLEDALKLVALRGQLMQKMPPGSMVSVHLPEGELRALLDDELSLAAVNEPNCCVVSGPNETIAGFVKELKKRKIENRRLLTSHAFHSKMMGPILKEFKEQIRKVCLNKPQIPYISNVTGKWLTVEEVTNPGYWAMHLRKTVRFSDGLEELLKDEETIFLEVGPGRALSTFVRQHSHRKSSHLILDLLRHPKQNEPDDRFLLDKIGQLWLNGKIIDWHAFYSEEKRQRMPLPTYPFERNRYWSDKSAPVLRSSEPWGTSGTFEKKDIADIEPEPPVEAGGTEIPKRTTWFRRPGLSTSYSIPQDDIEKELTQIWQNSFGIETVGIFDDFFELGGDSLKAATFSSKIRKALQVNVSTAEFFNRPTIKALAEYIKDHSLHTGGGSDFSLHPVEKKDYYVLSPAQKRMYIAHQMDVESVSYNITQAVVLVGNLDKKKFEETFRKLIMAHESFRTSFAMVEDEMIQRIHPDTAPGFKLDYFELTEEEAKPVVKNFRRPYDLGKPPLLRVGLIKTGEAKYILILDMYHIISDGVSLSILIRDFISLYKGEKLPPSIQYKDFSEWQNRSFDAEQIKRQEEYWLDRFKDEIPVLDMPTDYPRPAVRCIDEGDLITFKLEKELNKKLYEVVKQTGTTIFMFLLAVYYVFLLKHTKKEDIVVGSTITGRTQADLQNTIGMFVNMLALRNCPGKNKSFRQFLGEVKENALNAYENQDYPFDALVRKLGLQGETGRNPLCETEFAMGNIDIPELDIPGLKLIPYPNEVRFAKLDLHFLAMETNETINMVFRYSTSLFKGSTIETMKKDYIKILEQVLENIEIKLKDIKISYQLLVVKSNTYEDAESDFQF